MTAPPVAHGRESALDMLLFRVTDPGTEGIAGSVGYAAVAGHSRWREPLILDHIVNKLGGTYADGAAASRWRAAA
jgi:hypothetical protein